jgi:uncharacterized protein (DUF433 family)
MLAMTGLDRLRQPKRFRCLAVRDPTNEPPDIPGRFSQPEQRHECVVNLAHPRPHLEAREQRLSGWPTIAGTRIPYDAVAGLAEDGMSFERVQYFFPRATTEAIADAIDFHREVLGHPA